MGLISRRWQALILLSIIAILVSGCANQILPTTLKADKTVLSLGEHTNIECIVSNSTGSVSYNWSSSGGSMRGQGELIEWLAPDSAGNYFIKTDVIEEGSDKRGTAFITITVTDNHLPIIEDMVITADHKYIRTWKTGYLVGKSQEYSIECRAQDVDMDNLVYEWSCSEGDIQGSGSQITWIAPDVDCEIEITVTVSDGRGGVATQELSLRVVQCSACTFK